jgi:benzodiazapine receptor
MKKEDVLKLLVAIALCESAGIIGSVFTASSIPTWYATLQKPSFSPPNWVFGPVWTTLFALMGIAAFLIWTTKTRSANQQKEVAIAKTIFILQLVLNVLWSVVFFGLQQPGAAFIEIIFLWGAIVASIFFFSRISKTAAWLLAPYLAWVSFAAYLNYSIYLLNR